ncbi:MAG: ATP-binding cassette domain-containing protein, partial [Streptosporangiaceae bacterium]
MTTTTATTTAVEITDLVKRYGEVTALDGLDLTVPEGEVFGLLGPNGAGKTTAIETIVGLRTPSEGRVRALGLDPTAENLRLRRLVSVQPQHAALFPTLTVAETLRLWASFHVAAERPES